MKLEISTAKQLYPEAPEWFQNQLVEEFGADAFKPKVYENIKTFEDACKALMIDPETVFNAGDTTDEIAYKRLTVIVKAINNGWTPDWSDSDQYKYFPWFKVLPSGFGFSYSFSHYAYTSTLVGSRLCFESSEKCTYAAQQFIDIYNDFLTISK